MYSSEHSCSYEHRQHLNASPPYRSLRPLFMALIPGQSRSLEKAKSLREHLSNEVATLIDEFGPRLYGDFNTVCACSLTVLLCCLLSL